jgi:hypothetical protein
MWAYNISKPVTYEKCYNSRNDIFTHSLIGATYSTTAQLNDKGITVEGGLSDQKFGTTTWNGSMLGSYTMNIRLLGETEDNKVVRDPVTVRTLLGCKTCGTKNKATSKFCSECGTSLQIVE